MEHIFAGFLPIHGDVIVPRENIKEEILRCKACKFCKLLSDYECHRLREQLGVKAILTVQPDDFCAWSEMKDDD